MTTYILCKYIPE